MTSKNAQPNVQSKYRIPLTPTKYNRRIHPQLLVDLYSKGEGLEAFCAESMISMKTFYNWMAQNPEFAEAYAAAMMVGKRYWLALPRIKPDTPQYYWNSVMNGRFGSQNDKIRKAKSKNAADRVDAVWESLEEGELSVRNAKTLMDMALTQVHVEDRTPIEGQKATPRDELLKQIEMVKTVMDAQKGTGNE